ncbi:hypothetical protein BP6252_13205 [Coleophoma cylindrospora]|uniref:Uncharacterized protein n=1 Tax=Coleophoma cylindrospora TaxID=1849047 RepID=A0A3D8QAB0_9HELO|nr:hypothetical protein BP6252_13205 [Coleophoma cylindrospora]
MVMDGTTVGWQTSPSRRGTLTIIETCLFTIFACTWSIQHLNVPGVDEGWWKILRRKCKWAVFTVFFPEFLMAHAILEFVMVVEDMKALEKRRRLDNHPPWWFRWYRKDWRHQSVQDSGQHPHPTDRDLEASHEKLPSSVSGDVKNPWTLTHCYLANMGGFYYTNSNDSTVHRLLTARDFNDFWEEINVPDLSEDDLKDKSKTDYFTKGIAALQITQLVLSLGVRQARHLPYSQLETLTLAFAICGVLTYACSWYKPQGVNRPIKVETKEGYNPTIQLRSFDRLWHILTNSNSDSWTLNRIQNDNVSRAKLNETHPGLYLLTVLTAGFGSIHMIAWNFEFPTRTEQILWRTATLVSVALPPAGLLAIPLSQFIRPWGDSRDFMCTCLHVMREYSWHATDNQPVRDAMKDLRDACDNPKVSKHFKYILGVGGNPTHSLGERLLSFVHDNAALQKRLPQDFLPKFEQLVKILGGLSGSRKLYDKAKTDSYPQRRFSKHINSGIIYVTGIIYCIARLSIAGVAFSSLRSMPESVYTTTWAQNIPSIQ